MKLRASFAAMLALASLTTAEVAMAGTATRSSTSIVALTAAPLQSSAQNDKLARDAIKNAKQAVKDTKDGKKAKSSSKTVKGKAKGKGSGLAKKGKKGKVGTSTSKTTSLTTGDKVTTKTTLKLKGDISKKTISALRAAGFTVLVSASGITAILTTVTRKPYTGSGVN